jgi:hypothetical protein
LEISVDGQMKVTTLTKVPYVLIPGYWASIGSISISPTGKYLSYGDMSFDISIFSVQDQRVVADFKTPPPASHSYIVWSNDPQVLAYAYTGSFNEDWKMFAIGYDGSIHEILDLKPLIDLEHFNQSAISSFNENAQAVSVLVDSDMLGHIFILDVGKHQVVDTCLSAYAPRISWIDNDHIFVVAQAQADDNGMTYSLIVSKQTSDYYKITYDPILLPVGWVTDSSPPTPTPSTNSIPVKPSD